MPRLYTCPSLWVQILLLGLTMMPWQAGFAERTKLSAKEILDRVDDLYRSKSSHGKMTMHVRTAHWERTLRMEFWSKGKEKTLVRILAPKKERGTATLRSGNNVWNYLPKVKRVIKVPSSMMSASWMGSHFTNNDLVKEVRMAEDYTFEITAEKGRVVEITCIPKEGAAVVWGKVLVIADRETYLPVKIYYYDEDMELARTLQFDDIKEIGGRRLPVRLTVVPADKPSESTVIIHTEYTFDLEVDDSMFTLRALQKRR